MDLGIWGCSLCTSGFKAWELDLVWEGMLVRVQVLLRGSQALSSATKKISKSTADTQLARRFPKMPDHKS